MIRENESFEKSQTYKTAVFVTFCKFHFPDILIQRGIALLRDVDSVECGKQPFSDYEHDGFDQTTFLMTTEVGNWDQFLKKTFDLGKVRASTGGRFRICYCLGKLQVGVADCQAAELFNMPAGTLHITGPNIDFELTARVGVPFHITIYGSLLTRFDRAAIVLASPAGCSSATPSAPHALLLGSERVGSNSIKKYEISLENKLFYMPKYTIKLQYFRLL